ncbi:hypothetical protein BKA83DRAFT_4049123, partial [Pisolithus microcarpus]
AHLYLSPTGMLGEGNHSMVYKAEWELPRDLFVEPWMYHTCVHEQLMIQVHLLKRSRRWHEMMQQAGCKVSPATEKPGGIEYEMPVPPDTNEEFDMERIILLKPPSDSEHAPSYCAKYAVPRTSVFQVAAKLSIQHDAHLAREARNYQAFPDHFFQPWSGYNLIRQIHNPVPLHALVPQFYGYYVPVEEEASEKRPPPYLSPILLEHCGQPVDLSRLSEDDREECASLRL